MGRAYIPVTLFIAIARREYMLIPFSEEIGEKVSETGHDKGVP